MVLYINLVLFFSAINAKIGKTFETIDPRTGDVITKIAEGAKDDVDLAVKAARHAFDCGPWPRMPGTVRYPSLSYFLSLFFAVLNTIYF